MNIIQLNKNKNGENLTIIIIEKQADHKIPKSN